MCRKIKQTLLRCSVRLNTESFILLNDSKVVIDPMLQLELQRKAIFRQKLAQKYMIKAFK